MDILREKKYNHVMHFKLSAEQSKSFAKKSQADFKSETIGINKLIESNQNVNGISEIIDNHSLTEFSVIYKFDLDSSNTVFMFCNDEIKKTKYFDVLVLVKNNPNLNLIVDNVVKRLRHVDKFKKIYFSGVEDELVTTYHVQINEDKFEFRSDIHEQAQIDIVKKGTKVNGSKILKVGFLLIALFIINIIIQIIGKNVLIISIVSSIIMILFPFILDLFTSEFKKIFDEGKYNGDYIVLNTNYKFEYELKRNISSDPNISNNKLVTPGEE